MQVDDVKKILIDHKLSFQKANTEETDGWKWYCDCGEDGILSTKEQGTHAWRTHVAELIVTLDNLNKAASSAVPPAQDFSIPNGLSIMSFIVREVDCNMRSMPEGRKILGDWYNGLTDKGKVEAKTDGRARMRRLKQIMDATYEEFHNLTSQA